MPSMLIPSQVEEKGIEESPPSDDPPISDSKQPIIILIKIIIPTFYFSYFIKINKLLYISAAFYLLTVLYLILILISSGIVILPLLIPLLIPIIYLFL